MVVEVIEMLCHNIAEKGLDLDLFKIRTVI